MKSVGNLTADAHRLLVNLIKAHILDKFYEPQSDTFMDFDEIPGKSTIIMPEANASGISKYQPRPGTQDKRTLWYRLVIAATGDRQRTVDTLVELKWQLSGIPNMSRNPPPQGSKVTPRVDDRKPGDDVRFFLGAQLMVIQSANDVNDPFHKLYDPDGDRGRLVYKFDQHPDVNKFEFVTEQEARDLMASSGFTKADVPLNVNDFAKISGPNGKWFYSDVVNMLKPLESPLKPAEKCRDVVTRNFVWYVDNIKEVKVKYGLNVIGATKQPEAPQKQPEEVTAEVPIEVKQTKPKIAPKIQPRIPTGSQSVAGPALLPVRNAEAEERERLKSEWKTKAVAGILSRLVEKCETPAKRTKIYDQLRIASRLVVNKAKKNGTVFVLTTTRLIMGTEGNNKEGKGTTASKIITYLPADSLFGAAVDLDGRPAQIALAVNSDDKFIEWFTTGKNTTETKRTAGNKEFADWIRTEIIPAVWERFVPTCFADLTGNNVEPGELDEASIEERIKNTQGVVGATEKVRKTAFRKANMSGVEVGFSSRFVASLPMLPEELTAEIGGDPLAVQRQKASVAETVLKLESTNGENLKLISSNIKKLYEGLNPGSLIDEIRQDQKPIPAKVKKSNEPFVVKPEKTGNVEQVNVDFRPKMYPKTTITDENDL